MRGRAVRRQAGAFLLLFAALSLAGCYDAADPDAYPRRLEPARSAFPADRFADLDGDGRDEVLTLSDHASGAGHVGLLLSTLGGKVIEQANVPASYALPPGERPHALDLDGDGRLEVLLPLVRADSLFARVYDAEGRFRRQLFLAAGAPRPVDGGALAWDPYVAGFYLEDTDGDGDDDLVTVVRTGYARHPRGVLVHDLATGERLGELLVGTYVAPVAFADVDGDGRREMAWMGSAVENGAVAGGFSDDHAYVGLFALGPTPRVVWSRMADRRRYTWMNAAPLGPGGHRLVVTEGRTITRPGPSPLRVLDAATGDVLRERTWAAGVHRMRVGAGPGGEDRVYVSDAAGRLAALTPGLDPVASRSWPGGGTLQATVDLDGDGVDELVASTAGRYEFLDADLGTLAVLPDERARFGLVRQGPDRPPLVAVTHPDREASTVLYRVAPNPWWWLHRYGAAALLAAAALLLVGLTTAGLRWRRSHRLGEAVRTAALAGDERGLLVLAPDGSVAEANAALRRRLGLNGEAVTPDAVRARLPGLGALLDALPESPPHRREAAVELSGDTAPAWVVAEPLDLGRGGRPHWLVSVTPTPPSNGSGGTGSDGTWPLLARRVVHDLKNPLTSILLTLQRMQMEAHAHDPAAPAGDLAARLDPYVERVEGRVEHLRRMAHNLLKFLDAAAPDLAELDLRDAVDRAADALRPAMPPDVRLRVRPCPEPVPVRADEEQVGSAVENLVMNAVQAMPDGGAVTVQVRVARRLQPEGAPAPRDYAALEVMDTGRGMGPDERRRAFEPGFTTRDGGTGLGLALVRKVARDHGGFAEVESEPGTGTAVCLYLPLLAEANSPELDSPERDAAPDDPTPPRNAAPA